MKKPFILKRLLSVCLALTFFTGSFLSATGVNVSADTLQSQVSISNADTVISNEFVSGNGIYKIYTKNTAALIGLVATEVQSFSVPNTVSYGKTNYKVVWIGQSAFEGNTSIRKVSLSKNVKKICSRAFYGCTSLKNVSGGKGVTYTADDAFDNCPVLVNRARYYPKKLYNVGLAYIGKAAKPWRSKKVKAGRNGKGEITWITDNDLKTLGMTRQSFGNAVLAACRKMSGTVYTNDTDCISYCLSAYAKALGVATSVSKGSRFKIKFASNFKKSKKKKYAVNLMKKKKVINVSGNSISRNGANWFHCTNFAEHLTSKPNCYGGVRVSDYASLGEAMKALHAQPGDIVLFGGYVQTYLCKDGKYHRTNYKQYGGKKKVNGHYVRGEGGLFVWGHAAVYAGYNFSHTDKKGRVRNGQWFYETFRNTKSGLHWREPYYYAGKSNQRIMVIHIGNPTAVTKTEYVDPVKKILGNDAVDGAKYGIYRSEDEASRDFNRLATVTCGCPESDLPEINLGNTHSYDLGSGNRLTAKFYIRQLTDTGMLAPDKKAYLFRMKPENKNDVPAGWVKLTS